MVSDLQNTLILIGTLLIGLLMLITLLCVCCKKRRWQKPPNFPEDDPIDEFSTVRENGWAFENSTPTRTPATTPFIGNNTEFFPLNLTICEPIGAAPRIIPAPPIYYPQESMTDDPFFSLKKFSLYRNPEFESDSLERK